MKHPAAKLPTHRPDGKRTVERFAFAAPEYSLPATPLLALNPVAF